MTDAKYKCGHHGDHLETPDVEPDPRVYGSSLKEFGACRQCFPELFTANMRRLRPNDLPMTANEEAYLNRADAYREIIETARVEIRKLLDVGYCNASVGGYTPDEVPPLEHISAILRVADAVGER